MMPLPNENARPPSRPVEATEDAARSREAFCLALKAARLRRGVTLERISEVTKVCSTYFEGLEKNDLQHWPKGIFRRAFFRGYLETIGLPPADLINEFVRLFPEPGSSATLPVAPARPANPLRLGLDTSWHGPKIAFRSRALTATIDGVLVFAVAAALIVWTSLEVSTAIATASIGYFTLSRLLFGDSPVKVLKGLRVTRSSEQSAAEPHTTVSEPVEEAEDEEGEEDEEDDEDEREEPRERAWVSDARRVRPREMPSRMRVRIKMPTHSVHH